LFSAPDYPRRADFAARLHETLPDWNVRLLALGGYALTPGHPQFRTG